MHPGVQRPRGGCAWRVSAMAFVGQSGAAAIGVLTRARRRWAYRSQSASVRVISMNSRWRASRSNCSATSSICSRISGLRANAAKARHSEAMSLSCFGGEIIPAAYARAQAYAPTLAFRRGDQFWIGRFIRSARAADRRVAPVHDCAWPSSRTDRRACGDPLGRLAHRTCPPASAKAGLARAICPVPSFWSSTFPGNGPLFTCVHKNRLLGNYFICRQLILPLI